MYHLMYSSSPHLSSPTEGLRSPGQADGNATKQQPKMWGTGIVGFGSYHYKYESGREGDSCLTGFSFRKGDISVYLMGSFPERDDFLSRLGKHKMGKACLYVRKLSDVDLRVLEQLVAGSVAEMKRRYGQAQSGA